MTSAIFQHYNVIRMKSKHRNKDIDFRYFHFISNYLLKNFADLTSEKDSFEKKIQFRSDPILDFCENVGDIFADFQTLNF